MYCSLKTQLTTLIKVSPKSENNTRGLRLSEQNQPSFVTVTDSDQDRLASETHLAHLRSYKTVRVQLVIHHSLVMLCGNVSSDLAAAPLLSFSLFTYLLAYYFIFLPA